MPDTADARERTSPRRVRPTAWLIILFALTAATLFGIKAWQEVQQRREATLAAMRDVRQALGGLYRPFVHLYFIQFKGTYDEIQAANPALDAGQLDEKLVSLLPPGALADPSFVTFLGVFDGTALSGDVRLARPATYIESIAHDLDLGRARLRDTLQAHAGLLDEATAAQFEALASDEYIDASLARVSVVSTLQQARPGASISILPPSAGKTARHPVTAKYKAFIRELDEAWQRAEAPG